MMREDCDRQHNGMSLIDLCIIVLKYKFIFIISIFVFSVVGLIYVMVSGKQASDALTEPSPVAHPGDNFYSETTIMVPDVHKLGDFILFDRDLTEQIARKYSLPKIRFLIWNDAKQDWITEQIYVWEKDRLRILSQKGRSSLDDEKMPTMRIKKANDFLRISFSGNSAEVPQKIISDYFHSITAYYRKKDLENITANIRLLRQFLADVKDPVAKDKISEQLAVQMSKAASLESALYYPFSVISQPTIPELVVEDKISKVAPKKKITYVLIFSLLVSAAIIVAFLLALVLENIKKSKTNNPEKYEMLKKYMNIKIRK